MSDVAKAKAQLGREYQHLLGKSIDAVMGGYDAFRCQSLGEMLAVAMVLNRADWLDKLGWTIAEAIGRVGDEWVRIIPQVAEELKDQGLL